MIIDNFLDDFEWFSAYAQQLKYGTVENPGDSVDYDGISLDIPVGVASEVIYKIEKAIKKKIVDCKVFLRLQTEGMEAPHQAHNDMCMGTHALLVYMTDIGGTSLVKHKETGVSSGELTQEEVDRCHADTNNYDAWEVIGDIKATPNRGFILTSDVMHRAYPVGGQGSDISDGRLMLICFLTAV